VKHFWNGGINTFHAQPAEKPKNDANFAKKQLYGMPELAVRDTGGSV